MNELLIPHQVEPRNRYVEANDRPDTVTFDPLNGSAGELENWACQWYIHLAKRQ